MRESDTQRQAIRARAVGVEVGPKREVPCDEKMFFESFYRANVKGAPLDRMTIGAITDPEARFHYNGIENSIIRAWSRRNPPPPAIMVEAWRTLQRRADARLLDIGSGTGHWIDFFVDVFLVGTAIGIEITANMSEYLRARYAGRDEITILGDDVASDAFGADLIGGPVDFISAIGVMFHIVEDRRWEQAIRNLASVLKPDGLMFVGGEFGSETRNVQFHKHDEFDNWKAFDRASAPDGEIRVNKRVRSLAQWTDTVRTAGLVVVDLVRSEREHAITTAENDVLVLARADASGAGPSS